MIGKREDIQAAPMLVKRYAGRRLYNTVTLSYATPATLRAMVGKGQHVIVRDARTGDDITHEILDQPG